MSKKSSDHFFSRFTSGSNPERSEVRETHSSSESQVVSRQVRTETKGSGPNAVTKTIVTETIVGPDGSKKTVTKETTTTGNAGASADSDISSRFRSMDVNDDDRWGASSRPAQVKAAPEKKKPQKIKDFIEDVVKAQNKCRKLHGKVGDLKQSKDLNVLAQRWADHLASTNALGHSNDTYRGQDLGENVATKWSSAGADYSGQEVVDQWYNEVSKYDFRRNEFKQGTGHFTQVVWRGSKDVGTGKAFGRDGRVFVVCNYFPAGNVLGQFSDNVSPASK